MDGAGFLPPPLLEGSYVVLARDVVEGVGGSVDVGELRGHVGLVVVLVCAGLRAWPATGADPDLGPSRGWWSSLLSVGVVLGPPVG